METTGIGAYVREKRAQKGWTQKQLAEAAETSAAYISQIEGGKVGLPGADMRRRLARAFDVRHVDILVAAGELATDEIDQPDVPESPAEARLRPLLQRIGDNEALLNYVEESIRRDIWFYTSIQRGEREITPQSKGSGDVDGDTQTSR